MIRRPSKVEVAANTLAALAVAFVAAHVWIFTRFAPDGTDFLVFWQESIRGLYTATGRANLSNPHTHRLIYGWAGWFGLHTAFRIAALMGFAAYLVAAVPLARAVRAAWWAVPPVALMITAWPHTWIAAHNGHMAGVVLTLLALAWLDLEGDRNGRAGVWLGAALAMKLFVALPVAALGLTRHRRTAWIAVLVALAAYAAGALVWGTDVYVDHLALIQAAEVNPADESNFSLYVASLRTGVPWWPMVAAVLGLVGWSAWTGSAETALAAGTAGAVLLSPLSWFYYQPLLALPVLVCWKGGGWPRWAAAAGWWICAIYEPEFPALGGVVILAAVTGAPSAAAPARTEVPPSRTAPSPRRSGGRTG